MLPILLGSAWRPLTGKPQWCTDHPCSASSPAAATTGLGPSEVTCPSLLPLIPSCDSGPSSLEQQNSVLLALLPCLKLPPSYGNTQRSGCFELFFPGSLAALLSFSNLEHKTPLQKTEAKPQPLRNCWISLLKTTLQKAARCFFAHHCYLGNAFITEKWNSTYVFCEALLMQYQRDYFHD